MRTFAPGWRDAAAAVTGGWFIAAVLLGAPAVALIGGYYVSDLTGSGTAGRGCGRARHVRDGDRRELPRPAGLVGIPARAGLRARPRDRRRRRDRAAVAWRRQLARRSPRTGWWAVGTAANILVWLFVGWEAVAQLAGDFRRPEHDLPRSMAIAFGVVTVLYFGLAVATIGVTGGTESRRCRSPTSIAVGFGRAGRDATAVLAVALTMGTMNVYIGGMAKLAASLASEGASARLARRRRAAQRSRGGRSTCTRRSRCSCSWRCSSRASASTADLVRATSACFIAVYVLALLSAVRILDGRVRIAAACSLVLSAALAIFSAAFLAVPVVAAVVAVVLRRSLSSRRLAGASPAARVGATD